MTTKEQSDRIQEKHWAEVAIEEMNTLNPGDKIRVWDGCSFPPNHTLYHVRGLIDGCQLIVRRWGYKRRWNYQCLDAAWWSVYSKIESFKLTRKRIPVQELR